MLDDLKAVVAYALCSETQCEQCYLNERCMDCRTVGRNAARHIAALIESLPDDSMQHIAIADLL